MQGARRSLSSEPEVSDLDDGDVFPRRAAGRCRIRSRRLCPGTGATGVYAYNAQRVVAEGVGWDIVTLVLAEPALLVVVPLVAQGSFRGRLFAAGLLGIAWMSRSRSRSTAIADSCSERRRSRFRHSTSAWSSRHPC